MDRRRFLGLTSGIVAGKCLTGSDRAWAQVAPVPRPAAKSAATPAEPPVASAPGVSPEVMFSSYWRLTESSRWKPMSEENATCEVVGFVICTSTET